MDSLTNYPTVRLDFRDGYSCYAHKISENIFIEKLNDRGFSIIGNCKEYGLCGIDFSSNEACALHRAKEFARGEI